VQLDIILEPNLTPAEVAEVAVAAENYGFRTLWHSNYHQNPDAFMALVPAALATSRIKLGVLAISPYEIQPLKIGNALLTLNEFSNGRAIAAIGGGGSVMGACGIPQNPKALRIVRGVRSAEPWLRRRDLQGQSSVPPHVEDRSHGAGVHCVDGEADARDGRPRR
jgi:alkanesulfonate monooxygenase SsuD/methylene tetrahydromethanopterin reductase-like flavin-dependent oxidoreductase (luciferase family)